MCKLLTIDNYSCIVYINKPKGIDMLIINGDREKEVVFEFESDDITDYFLALDLIEKDHMMTKLNVLEQTTSPAATVNINGTEFTIPNDWNILVTDDLETSLLDLIPIQELANKDVNAAIYGWDCIGPEILPIVVNKYVDEFIHIFPSIKNHQLICIPISDTKWICVTPYNSYTKYLDGLTIGEFI